VSNLRKHHSFSAFHAFCWVRDHFFSFAGKSHPALNKQQSNALERPSLSFSLLLAVFVVAASVPAWAQQTMRVIGAVHDNQGLGVRATVQLIAPGNNLQTTATDDNGNFAFDNVTKGRCELLVEAGGFETVTRPIDLEKGSSQIDIRLAPKGVATEISVTATETKATASGMDVPNEEIPAQVSTIPSSLIRQQGVNDLVTALRNVSGVTAQKIYGVYEYYTVRGFNTGGSDAVVVLSDGMRLEGNRLNSQLNSVQSVEVLKGPASILYGSGALAGAINIIHKKPQATPTFDLVYRGGSYATNQIAGGAAGRFFGLDPLLYRVDASFENSGGWRNNGAKRINVSPTITWLIGNRAQFTVSEFLNRDRFKTDAGVPAEVLNIPGFKLSTSFDTPQDFELGTDALTQTRLNVNLSERWQLRDSFALRIFDDQYYTAESLSYDAAASEVDRQFLYFKHHRRPKQNMADVLGRFHFAGMDHIFVAGYEYEDYYNYTDESDASDGFAPPMNVFTLKETYVPVSSFPISQINYFENLTNAFYWQDQIALAKRWNINVGGRESSFKRTTHSDTWDNGQVISRSPDVKVNQTAYNYRAGIVFAPTTSQELYFSSGSSFSPVTVTPRNGKQLLPETGQSYEGGYRWRPLQGRLNFNAAIYRLVRQNVLIPLPGGNFNQAGQESSKGVDFDATGTLARGIRFNLNYGYTLPRFDNYNDGVMDLSGNQPDFTQKHAVNIWLTKLWKERFTSSIGMRYQSRTFIDDENAFLLGGFTVFQGAVSYRHKSYDVSVNAENLFNRHRYFPGGLYENQVYPGAPLSVYGSVRFHK
jgi:iron complex outermembrane recepter protein